MVTSSGRSRPDTTISVGGLFRLGDPDPQYYGITSKFGSGIAGLQRSVNNDDGNLNYRSGMASFLVKASHDLLLKYKDDAGVFVRGYYFNDFVNTNGSRGHAPLSDEAKRIVGENAELLDAYVYFKPTLGTMPASLRIGRQVLSWGESTFIPNGINSINPIDVGKLRTPGSELKEALRPVNMVSASLTLTETLSLEAFYLLDWERTRIDPPGSYFSNNDYAAKGGTKVMLGFGAIADGGTLGGVPRGRDKEPGSSGQYGLNLRLLAHGLKDTEFGLFFMNYHSRLPAISARLVVDQSAVGRQVHHGGSQPMFFTEHAMTYRSLLVYLSNDPLCAQRTQAAIALARRLDAHLVGLAPTGLVNLPMAMEPMGSLGEFSVLAYNTRPGVSLSESARMTFYGRL